MLCIIPCRAIAKELSAARVPYTVKILAYKNGEGRMKPGELIVGSSVPGVCFIRFTCSNAWPGWNL